MTSYDYSEIVNHITAESGVSIVEIQRILERQGVPYEGDITLQWPHESIVIWPGASEELKDVLERLVVDRRVEVVTSEPLVYYIAGVVPNMEIAKVSAVERGHVYKQPRWLPITFNRADANRPTRSSRN